MTIKDCWKEFFKYGYPDGAEPEQFSQVRKAFYAGWAAATSELSKIAERGPDEEETMRQFKELDCELLNFLERAQRGEV